MLTGWASLGLRRESRRSDPSEVRGDECILPRPSPQRRPRHRQEPAAARGGPRARPREVRGARGRRQHRHLRAAVRRPGPGAAGRPAGRALRRRAAALGGRRAARPGRRAGRSCSPSTTRTCSTRRPPRWCTCWSARAPRCSARCAPASRSRPRSAHCGPTTCVDHAELAPLTDEESRDLLADDARRAGRGRLGASGCGGCRRQRAAAARAGDGRARRRRDDPGVRALAVDRPARAWRPAWPT